MDRQSIRGALPLLIIFIILMASTLSAQTYYLNTYDYDDQNEMYVYTKAVDLNSSSVISSVKLNERGIIMTKKPLSIRIANGDYLLVFSENGGYNKNSDMGSGHYVVYYHILAMADDLELVRSDSLVGAMILPVRQYPSEDGFRMNIRTDNNERDIFPYGIYNLGNRFNFILRQPPPFRDRPNVLYDVVGHDYLTRLCTIDECNIYSAYPKAYTILRLNENNSVVLDSMIMPKTVGQINQFALNAMNNKIYVFNLNYEVHGEFMDQGRAPDAPAPRVYIYDADNFELLETSEIADYPENNYPSAEEGIAEVIGDYIVYYFFEDDWLGRFNPAMLFIFDTRTNEASWLRVGWR